MRESRSLIVGVDGSAAALAALRWAGLGARLLGAEVVAVHVWQPSAAMRAPYAPVGDLRTQEQDRSHALDILDATVAQVRERDPEVAVRTLLAQGAPARVLLDHCRHALLLALGRGAREDVTQPVLGAVARTCIRHATCPVVTVPESLLDAAPADPAWLPEPTAV
ncbi:MULTISPECIES: universal stress protein [unclassified Streptomyces]|uniref:universal stress protein n=1 Tax=Streptomyces sp. SYP-A7185 TaxID=3040076 RepID=UPI0038F73DAF